MRPIDIRKLTSRATVDTDKRLSLDSDDGLLLTDQPADAVTEDEIKSLPKRAILAGDERLTLGTDNELVMTPERDKPLSEVEMKALTVRDALVTDRRLTLDENDNFVMTNQPDNSAIGTAASKDHGTAPEQVPLNSNLGSASKTDTGTNFDQVPLNTNIVYPVATVADLRLLEPTVDGQRFNVTSYYDGWAATVRGPVGGGEFVYDASDTTSVDDGGSVFVTATGGRIKRKLSDYVTPEMFGAYGDDTNDDSMYIQSTYDYAKNKKLKVVFDSVTYLTSTSINGYNVSCESATPTRAAKIHYTGNDYALKHEGEGSESGDPETRFKIQDIYLSGDLNVNSLGGLYVDRCYIVEINNVFSTGWNNPNSVSVHITNVFNLEWSGGQIANGFPETAGAEALAVGSTGVDAWNTSNVVFKNTLIQYSGGDAGCKVIHDSNVMDNLTFDNVSFGKNKGWSIYSDSPDVNNITLKNCHFESCGYNSTATPEAGVGHVSISNGKCLVIDNNSFQDAETYIHIENLEAFDIRANKLFESGAYTITGSVAYDIRATATRNCVGRIGPNSVRTDQIDSLLNVTESGGYTVDIDLFTRKKVSETTWNAAVFSDPISYQGTIVNRVGSLNAPYDQMYSPDGSSWGRMMFSTRYKGERSTIPTTTETAGSFYNALNATEVGTTGDKYIVSGWKTTGGGSWFEMRTLTGN